jgi:hypothetical protein
LPHLAARPRLPFSLRREKPLKEKIEIRIAMNNGLDIHIAAPALAGIMDRRSDAK